MLALEYRNDEVAATLVFDDDDRVAYAYLTVETKIVGDVWLYNVADPPKEPEWPDLGKVPYINPSGHISEERFDPVRDANEIAVEWETDSSTVQQVIVTLRGKVHAVLRPGAKPGWCRLASKANPIAKPLHEID